MVILGQRFGYFTEEEVLKYRTECIRLNGTIQSLIKSMRVEALRSVAPWLVPMASWLGLA
jgi:hypothetical protein